MYDFICPGCRKYFVMVGNMVSSTETRTITLTCPHDSCKIKTIIHDSTDIVGFNNTIKLLYNID